jgi:hypothetical protein
MGALFLFNSAMVRYCCSVSSFATYNIAAATKCQDRQRREQRCKAAVEQVIVLRFIQLMWGLDIGLDPGFDPDALRVKYCPQ